MKEPRTRFLEKVKKIGSCWIWTGTKYTSGYGKFTLYGKHVGAHVASYLLFVGMYDRSLYMTHSCDVKECVNPEHLRPGTPGANNSEAYEKGRKIHWNSKKEECKNGHPFNKKNTYITSQDKRFCRECNTERQRRLRGNSKGRNEAIKG